MGTNKKEGIRKVGQVSKKREGEIHPLKYNIGTCTGASVVK